VGGWVRWGVGGWHSSTEGGRGGWGRFTGVRQQAVSTANLRGSTHTGAPTPTPRLQPASLPSMAHPLPLTPLALPPAVCLTSLRACLRARVSARPHTTVTLVTPGHHSRQQQGVGWAVVPRAMVCARAAMLCQNNIRVVDTAAHPLAVMLLPGLAALLPRLTQVCPASPRCAPPHPGVPRRAPGRWCAS
jgi:hypothetical protein